MGRASVNNPEIGKMICPEAGCGKEVSIHQGSSPLNLFYTRRIVNPDGCARKAAGKSCCLQGKQVAFQRAVDSVARGIDGGLPVPVVLAEKPVVVEKAGQSAGNHEESREKPVVPRQEKPVSEKPGHEEKPGIGPWVFLTGLVLAAIASMIGG